MIGGGVLRPGAPAYEAARRPAIARFHDARPAAVALCESNEDVAQAIEFARRSGLPVTARSGGHDFAGRSTGNGVVVDVSPLSSVTVGDGTATIGAGARLGRVYDALLEHDATIPAGCGPEVGIAGLTLGGGLGILGRKHGLTCDSLLAAQVVLADGRVVDCDEDHDPDLFWALRGAGGCHLGVVTSLAFETVAPPPSTAFHLVWPFASAAAVARTWQAWAPTAPDELAASLLITASPDPARSPQVNVFGALLGLEDLARELLAELGERAGADPESAEFRHGWHRETKNRLVELGLGDERPGAHPYSRSEYFREPLPEAALGELLAGFAGDRIAGESRELDFTPWGGAYNRVPAEATAFAHREELFLLKQAAVVDPRTTGGPSAWLERSWEGVHPYGSGGVYPNFPDPELEDPSSAYHGPNAERLREVKARYDPERVFAPYGASRNGG